MRPLFLAAGLLFTSVAAAAPFDLSHTARVLDSTGAPLDGAHDITLTLYASGSSVWSQTYNQVDVEAGYYSVVLGGVDSAWFAGPVQLGVSLDGAPELTPRQTLGSVPHAMSAEVASRLAVVSEADASACTQEGQIVWDSTNRSVRVCDADGQWTGVGTTTTRLGGYYEHVYGVDSAGNTTHGSWAAAVQAVTQDMGDCVLRFDDRLAEAEHIEWTASELRFDFQPLHAIYNEWDSYAFIALTANSATLNSTYRRGNASEIYKRGTEQHPISYTEAQAVDLYCQPAGAYTHVASFNGAGGTTAGSWEDLYAAAVDRGATCKVRWDNRSHRVPHIEHTASYLYLDFLGLSAAHDGYDAFAYAHIDPDNRAGIGTSYHRGHYNSSSDIATKDRTQHAAVLFNAQDVDIFCADDTADTWTMNASGAMTTGTWDSLFTAVVDEARDCTVAYDGRVSRPEYIEYAPDYLQFDFQNLNAWHNSHDAFAAVRLHNGSLAELSTTYREGNSANITLKTEGQHPWGPSNPMEITVRCEASSYDHELSLSSGGVTMHGDWPSFYTAFRDTDVAPDCKLRWDGRISNPDVVERLGDGYRFDHQNLASHHSDGTNRWESYATFVTRGNGATGSYGTYRQGIWQTIYTRGDVQHALNDFTGRDVDVLCR